MSIRTETEFQTLYGTTGSVFPDNTTQEISESDMRSFGQDLKDSILFIRTLAPIALDTSGSTVTVNLNNGKQIKFYGTIGENKTIALSNSTYASEFTLVLTFSAIYNLTFPVSFKSFDPAFASNVFTPLEIGTYICKAESNGTNWFIEFSTCYA